jgi:hypothetical protein
MRAFDKEAEERGAVYSKLALDNAAHFKVIDPLIRLLGYEDYSKTYLKRFGKCTS